MTKIERPKCVFGITERVESTRGRIYVTVNSIDGVIMEVFVRSNDQEAEAIGRIVALALRSGSDIDDVIDQLWKVDSREVITDVSENGTVVKVRSIAQAVALVIGRTAYGSSWAGPLAEKKDLSEGKESKKRKTLPQKFSKEKPEVIDTTSSFADSEVGMKIMGVPLMDGTATVGPIFVKKSFSGLCPDCGAALQFGEGCRKCLNCGYSKCG